MNIKVKTKSGKAVEVPVITHPHEYNSDDAIEYLRDVELDEFKRVVKVTKKLRRADVIMTKAVNAAGWKAKEIEQ